MSTRPGRARWSRLLGTAGSLALLLATTACGTDTVTGSASDPAPSSSPRSSTSGADPQSKVGADADSGGTLAVGDDVTPGQAQVVSASDVDAEKPVLASALPDEDAVEAYLAGLDPRLADKLRPAIEAAQSPSDHMLFASVVSVGCDEPTVITWTKSFEGISADATLPEKGVQCLVPVTSVALFLVPGLVS